MEQPSPQVYATERLKEGVTPDIIKQNLLVVGWPEEDVDKAIVGGLVANGVPTPPSGARSGRGKLSSTVEVVLNFFSFITLGVVATALGTLYYQIINSYFPDPLIIRYGSTDVSPETIHYAIAALIITFPIYVFSVRLWFKRFREDMEKVETKLTKWFTYLVLLVSALTILGDLITAVFYFLQGEITPRFFLKALTILVIAGIIFGFYFLERKKIQYRKDIPRNVFQQLGWVITILVVVAILAGFVVGGSPSTARSQGFDVERANDLRSIASCLSLFGGNQKRLPDSLDELSQNGQYAYCSANLSDPETGASYDYQVTNPSLVESGVREGEFELCADFATDSQNATAAKGAYNYPLNDKWTQHSAGHNCDTEQVNLERSVDLPPPDMTPSPVSTKKI